MNVYSIKNKLLSLAILVSLILFVLMVFVIPSKTNNLADDILEENAAFTANLLSENLALGMQTMLLDDGSTLQQTLDLIKNKDSSSDNNSISNVLIYDADLTFIKGLNKNKDISITKCDSLIMKNEKKQLIATLPMRDADRKILGYVNLTFSKKMVLSKISQFTRFSLIVGFCIIAGLCMLIMVISNSIVTPVNKTIKMLTDMASGDGDLTVRLSTDGKDEIGELSKRFNMFVEKLQKMIASITSTSSIVSKSSKDLASGLNNIAQRSKEASNKSRIVSTSAEDATNNISSISTSTQQMSSSAVTVAGAIEEMSASLNEVSRNCVTESQLSKKANDLAYASKAKMEKINEAAKKISKVVDLINDIADQTNLLALNATIEAATAGDAGRGFSVVANEVKELAKQTALATSEISSNVDEMQQFTRDGLRAIDEVTNINNELNTVSQTIVSSVEEQSATISEIAKNISEVSRSATGIADNVRLAAAGISEVRNNIKQVENDVVGTTDGVTLLTASASTLDKEALELDTIVGQFKI